MSHQIKILFLAANPLNTDRLLIDEENRAIKAALVQTPYGDRFEFQEEWAVRISDLQAILLRHKPNIIHFSGHGSPQGEIILANEARNGIAVSNQVLSQLFAILKDDIRCVILNACYSETQANRIGEYIDCVIGTPGTIGDESAINFSSAFYLALGFGRNLKTAFELGCEQIVLENLDDHTPKFISRLADPYSITFELMTSENDHNRVIELTNNLQPTLEIHQDIVESDNITGLEAKNFRRGTANIVQKIKNSNAVKGVVINDFGK